MISGLCAGPSSSGSFVGNCLLCGFRSVSAMRARQSWKLGCRVRKKETAGLVGLAADSFRKMLVPWSWTPDLLFPFTLSRKRGAQTSDRLASSYTPPRPRRFEPAHDCRREEATPSRPADIEVEAVFSSKLCFLLES